MSSGLNRKFVDNARDFMATRPIRTSALNVNQGDRPAAIRHKLINGGLAEFNFRNGGGNSVALEMLSERDAGNRLPAYWLPQGKYVDIPVRPASNATLFTAELTGCAVHVHKLNAAWLRVFHVHMNHIVAQYTNVPRGVGPALASVQANDYLVPGSALRYRGVAAMHFNTGLGHRGWALLYQGIESPVAVVDPPMSIWTSGGIVIP